MLSLWKDERDERRFLTRRSVPGGANLLWSRHPHHNPFMTTTGHLFWRDRTLSVQLSRAGQRRRPSGTISSISPRRLQHRGRYSRVEPSPVASPPAALKVGSIHVIYTYKTKELTRLKAKLNNLKLNDASGIFLHALLFDTFQTGVILTADFLKDTRTFFFLLHSAANIKNEDTSRKVTQCFCTMHGSTTDLDVWIPTMQV